ncbi:MAG TPA: ABC transporter permease [Vineibacter sp.]|nr:ABC transporter permease [Vineibacter sp.]
MGLFRWERGRLARIGAPAPTIDVSPSADAAGECGRDARAPSTITLKASLRRIERRQALIGAALVAPLLLFLAVNFLLPIALMLFRSVDDPDVRAIMPRTAAALATWDGRDLPPATVATLMIGELEAARGGADLSRAANRLNYDINGFRSLLLKTARNLPSAGDGDARQALLAIDQRWGDVETWAAIKRAAGPLTGFYLLGAVDLKQSATGEIQGVSPDRAIFLKVLARTLWIGFWVTVLCLALGYPVAYLLATASSRTANLLMILVLLPFWTSLLVRTTAWVVLLQKDGPVNGALHGAGLIDEPLRLIFNRVGVYVAITHVLLPFMILPLYSVMKGIGPSAMRAAVSLGAHPFVAFARVYLPQTVPGITAGTLLVFISAIGYYVTPALIGGADDQMLSTFIAFYTNETTNWGMAAALGGILLVITALLYAVYDRLAGRATVGLA